MFCGLFLEPASVFCINTQFSFCLGNCIRNFMFSHCSVVDYNARIMSMYKITGFLLLVIHHTYTVLFYRTKTFKIFEDILCDKSIKRYQFC